MAVCEICGCKTEELDFVVGSLNGKEKKMCSFCHKQLKAIGEKATEPQLRWLNAVISKDVSQRSSETASELKEYFEKLGGSEISAQAPIEKVYKAQAEKQPVVLDADKDKLILELVTRVEKLENTLLLMKRKQIIKTIIEIVVPIILGIIILIVFFSSGLFDTLSDLYSSFI